MKNRIIRAVVITLVLNTILLVNVFIFSPMTVLIVGVLIYNTSLFLLLNSKPLFFETEIKKKKLGLCLSKWKVLLFSVGPPLASKTPETSHFRRFRALGRRIFKRFLESANPGLPRNRGAPTLPSQMGGVQFAGQNMGQVLLLQHL